MSIFLPNWVTYNSATKIYIHLTYGLTRRCSSYSPIQIFLTGSITDKCYAFPTKGDCSADANLCHTWKSATFLLYLAAFIEGMTLVAYIAVFNGVYARRLNGWKVLSLLHTLIGIPLPHIPPPPPFSGGNVDVGRSSTVTSDVTHTAQLQECRYIRATRMESRGKLGSRHGQLFPHVVCSRGSRCLGQV